MPRGHKDRATRAEHNAAIIEANKERHANNNPARQHPEQQRLREAQTEARRVLYKNQRQNRDTLRAAHAAGLNQHKAWAKQLYATARKAAFEQVKEQTDNQWKAVRAIEIPDQRDKAAEALKLEQKSLYAKTAAERVAELRPQKNEAWAAMTEESWPSTPLPLSQLELEKSRAPRALFVTSTRLCDSERESRCERWNTEMWRATE